MSESNKFDSISPYTDKEAVDALSKVANHPAVLVISKYLFPKESMTYLKNILKNLNSIEEFQDLVMSKAIDWILNNTADKFTYSGFENIKDHKYLFMSNHRDIILDPAIMQCVLHKNNFPMTEICVGDNLISHSKVVEYLLRSNRMIKVIRGISARELYISSKILSTYIRETICSEKSSVWIAQKQGRTKNGLDTTEQGLLKMLDMSGEKDFIKNYSELNILPLSISYEYEPCDYRKARETLISRTEKYVKGKKEDLHSILLGIKQKKGNIHLSIGSPLTIQEIEQASSFDKNDRYQELRHILDRKIIEGYKLWKTNYIAYDMVYNTNKYSDKYTPEQVIDFEKYINHKLSKVERSLNREELRDIFLKIYSNPVLAKEELN